MKQYKRIFEIDGVELVFDDDVLDYIVDKAAEIKLGARGLRSICEAIMTDVMYETPSRQSSGQVRITLDVARERIENDKFLFMKNAG